MVQGDQRLPIETACIQEVLDIVIPNTYPTDVYVSSTPNTYLYADTDIDMKTKIFWRSSPPFGPEQNVPRSHGLL